MTLAIMNVSAGNPVWVKVGEPPVSVKVNGKSAVVPATLDRLPGFVSETVGARRSSRTSMASDRYLDRLVMGDFTPPPSVHKFTYPGSAAEHGQYPFC